MSVDGPKCAQRGLNKPKGARKPQSLDMSLNGPK